MNAMPDGPEEREADRLERVRARYDEAWNGVADQIARDVYDEEFDSLVFAEEPDDYDMFQMEDDE